VTSREKALRGNIFADFCNGDSSSESVWAFIPYPEQTSPNIEAWQKRAAVSREESFVCCRRCGSTISRHRTRLKSGWLFLTRLGDPRPKDLDFV